MNSHRLRLGHIARISLLLAAAVGAAWLTVAIAAAELLRTSRPDAALRIARHDARAKAVLAALALGSGRTLPDFERARVLAREALERDPTIVPAWRMLGMVEAGQQRLTEARRAFQISERLSRRDLPTQLWLIEEKVRRNDVAGAVHHYDVALRTSRAGRDMLIPILVSATTYPWIVQALAPVLANDPPWAADFYEVLVRTVPSGDGAARLVEALRRRGPLVHETQIHRLIPALVEKREFAAAWRVYQATAPTGQSQATLRNGNFESRDQLPTFEWDLRNGVDLRAEVRPSAGVEGTSALFAHASDGAMGVAARQLLVLRPGSYEFRVIAGLSSSPAPERVRWNLKCAESESPLFGLDITPRQPGRRLHRTAFRVPASDCRAQWLDLEVGADELADDAEAWVDSVVIRPTAR